MIRPIFSLAVLCACTVLSGCATIVHGGPREIPVASTPPGAKVSVYDREEKLVFMNTTPFVANLSTKYKYFRSNNFRMVFELDGYAAAEVRLRSELSGWYFGNLLIGGAIGMLIVDPLTGAMFNLTPEKIEQPLTSSQTQVIRDGEAIMVILASQATPRELAQMVRVN